MARVSVAHSPLAPAGTGGGGKPGWFGGCRAKGNRPAGRYGIPPPPARDVATTT